MTKVTTLIIFTSVLFSGCSNEPSYPSSEGMQTPYILKEGCKFTITEELSKASITSPTVTGIDEESVSMGISLGDKSINVSNCNVIENSHNLPIYEN